MASTEVKVRMNPREGFQTVITAGKQTLLADEPVSLGGTNTQKTSSLRSGIQRLTCRPQRWTSRVGKRS